MHHRLRRRSHPVDGRGVRFLQGEELVKAVVVPSEDCQERELIRYCRERLADYKVPSRVEFRDEIPVGPGGKVLQALRRG